MVVGCLEVTLSIPEAHSLKEKRSVVRRCIERARNRFNVSVSEVGENDVHNLAVVAVAAVANDSSFVNSVLDKVLDHVESDSNGYAEILRSKIEILHVHF